MYQLTTYFGCVQMTHTHSSPIVVQAFAAPFARYPGYVFSATRSRDQHVIVIVLTRPASTDSRLVRKLAHAQHHAAPPKRRQNNVKNVTGRKIGVDRPWPASTLSYFYAMADPSPLHRKGLRGATPTHHHHLRVYRRKQNLAARR